MGDVPLRDRAWTTRQILNDRRAGAAFAHGDGHARHRPVEVYLQIASACNLDCYMCSEHLRPPNARRGRGLVSMSPELYAQVADQLFPYSMRVTFGVGGEPMLSPHFGDFVRTAHARGQAVHVTTNGTRIVDDAIAEMLARCTRQIDISLDGATRATYERIRLGSSFVQMRANLERLRSQRARVPAAERGILRYAFVMMRSNVHELPDFVRMAAELGADVVHAQHVIPITEEGRVESLFEDRERCDHYVHAALRTGAGLGIEVDLPRPWNDAPRPGYTPAPPPAPPEMNTERDPLADAGEAPALDATPAEAGPSSPAPHADALPPIELLPRAARIGCHLPTLAVYVFFDGRVYPCCHPYAHRQMKMGDLRVQRFEEIWNGRAWRNLRAGLASGSSSLICRACSIVQSPPLEREDPDVLLAPEHAIGQLYGALDLAPVPHARLGARLAAALERGAPVADGLWSDDTDGRAVAARRLDKLTRVLNGMSRGAPEP